MLRNESDSTTVMPPLRRGLRVWEACRFNRNLELSSLPRRMLPKLRRAPLRLARKVLLQRPGAREDLLRPSRGHRSLLGRHHLHPTGKAQRQTRARGLIRLGRRTLLHPRRRRTPRPERKFDPRHLRSSETLRRRPATPPLHFQEKRRRLHPLTPPYPRPRAHRMLQALQAASPLLRPSTRTLHLSRTRMLPRTNSRHLRLTATKLTQTE